MKVLPQKKKYGKTTYELHSTVNTLIQKNKLVKKLKKTMAVRAFKGKNSAGKVVYGIYTAWKS